MEEKNTMNNTILKRLGSCFVSTMIMCSYLNILPVRSAIAEDNKNEKLYASVLNEYVEKIIPNGLVKLNDTSLLWKYSDHWMYPTGNLSDYSYVFYDLNSDGVDELFITDPQYNMISEIYTLVNGTPKEIATGLIRSNYYVLNEKNVLEKIGSGGANYHSFTFYHLTNGNLVPFERYDNVNGTWYYASGGNCDTVEQDSMQIVTETNVTSKYPDIWCKNSTKLSSIKSYTFSTYSPSTSQIETENKCGDNAFWSFDETTGLLTISGTGSIYDYNKAAPIFSYTPNDPPYSLNMGYIKAIEIQEGITSIGNKAFYGSYTAVTSIKLPESLEYIGDYALYTSAGDETPSTSITIPKKVSHIGEKAIGYYDYNTIDENNDLIGISGKIPGFTIYGYKNTVAEKYANENGLIFVAVDDFEEIPAKEKSSYEEYYINTHLTNYLEEEHLWYRNYKDSSNAIGTTYKLLEYDAKKGFLNSSLMLDKEVDAFDLKFLTKDFYTEFPIEPKAYYAMVLAQFIADSYSEEELSSYASKELADITKELFDKGLESEIVEKFIESSSDVSLNLDKISTIPDIIDHIKSLKDTTGVLEDISKVGDVAFVLGLTSEILDDYSEHTDNIRDALKAAVYYRAFRDANEHTKFVFKQMRANTDDIVLQEVLDGYINVLDTEDCDTFIHDTINSLKRQETIEMAVDIKNTVVEQVLCYVIDHFLVEDALVCPYLLIPIGVKLAVNIENSVVDNLMDTEKLYYNVSKLVAYSSIHQALYDSYNNYLLEFKENQSYYNAQNVHAILQCYQSVDLMAIVDAEEYIPRFTHNNAIMSVIAPNYLRQISDILECEWKNTFSTLQNMNQQLSNLEERYMSTSCCLSEDDWEIYVSALHYFVGNSISGSISLSAEALKNWREKNKTMLEKWYNDSIDVILIGCPVTVNVYDTDNNMIAHLSDVECDVLPPYSQFFFTCNETNDTLEEKVSEYTIESTKGKMLILPHDTTEYRYEILGTDSGTMNITSYHVNNISDIEWFNNKNYEFKDVHVTDSSVITIDKNDNNYVIIDLGKKEKINNKRIMVVVLILSLFVITVICLMIIIHLKNKKKKTKRNGSNNWYEYD